MPLDSNSGASPEWPPITPQQPTPEEHVPQSAPQTPPEAAPPRVPTPQQPPAPARRPGFEMVNVDASAPRPGGTPVYVGRRPQPAPVSPQRPPQAPPVAARSTPEVVDDEPERVSRIGKVVLSSMLIVVLGAGVAGADEVFNRGRTLAKIGIGSGDYRENTKSPWANDSTVAQAEEEVADEPTSEPTPTPTETASPSPSPTSTPTSTPSPTAKASKAPVALVVPAPADCVEKLPDATLIAQKIMAPVQGDSLAAMSKEFDKRHIGGAILLTSPKDPNDGSIKAFKSAQDIKIEVATNQEGGDPTDKTITGVSSIKAPITELEPKGYMPSAAAMAKMKPEEIRRIVRENYKYLKDVGVDTSFVVVDVAPATGTAKIGVSRIASKDPIVVATYAAAYIKGAEQAKVNPVIEHWGQGEAANADTATAVAPDINVLKSRDFTVYTALLAAGLDARGLIGSQAIPGLTIEPGKDKKLKTTDDIKTPASLSKSAVNLFKTEYLAKEAITYTDDLGAPAIATKMPVAKAMVAAWIAGVDVGSFESTLPKDGKNPVVKMTVPEQLDAGIAEGVAAIKNKTLPRAEVVASVTRLFAAKHVGACALLKETNPTAYTTLTTPKAPAPTPSAPGPAPKATPTTKPTTTAKATPTPTSSK